MGNYQDIIQNNNELNQTRLLQSDTFIRDTKKYESRVKPFLDFIQKNISENGTKFLYSRKGTKRLTNCNAYEFRSIIRGQRIIYKFGWQLKDTDLNINDEDIILCRYVEHDDITYGARSINDSKITISSDSYNLEECQVDETNEDIKENRIYVFNKNNNFLIPILDKQQENILNDPSKYVFVNGIAGSGKTNICIQKIVLESIQNKKIVYSTFSYTLLDSTRQNIHYNYIDEIQQIIKSLESG